MTNLNQPQQAERQEVADDAVQTAANTRGQVHTLISLTPAQQEGVAKLTEATKSATIWTDRAPRHEAIDSAMKAAQASGLIESWRRHEFHPTRRMANFEGKVRPVFTDDGGNLWAPVFNGWGQDCPSFYAPCGKLDGAGALIPLALLEGTMEVHVHPCDCGYSNGELSPVWGDRDEQHAARQVLIKAFQDLEK